METIDQTSKFICPKSKRPCDMAEWTASHIRAQFRLPSGIREEVIRSVLAETMQCAEQTDDCLPPEPAVLFTAVESRFTL